MSLLLWSQKIDATLAELKARPAALESENARLKARLQQAELILDIQKKASELLGIPLKAFGNEGSAS